MRESRESWHRSRAGKLSLHRAHLNHGGGIEMMDRKRKVAILHSVHRATPLLKDRDAVGGARTQNILAQLIVATAVEATHTTHCTQCDKDASAHPIRRTYDANIKHFQTTYVDALP